MIVMLDTSHDLTICSTELGCEVEQLLTPLTRYRRQNEGSHFAIDNGAFSGFDSSSFCSLLKREEDNLSLCRWVAVPDVVGSALRTIEVFRRWEPKLRKWPLAFVAQDGQEALPIPWDEIKCVFIGGSTEFKISKEAIQIIRTAQALNKWVHVGRVNTPGRFEHFEKLRVDSIDGTGLSRYTWMRKAIYERYSEPRLFDGSDTQIREDIDCSAIARSGSQHDSWN